MCGGLVQLHVLLSPPGLHNPCLGHSAGSADGMIQRGVSAHAAAAAADDEQLLGKLQPDGWAQSGIQKGESQGGSAHAPSVAGMQQLLRQLLWTRVIGGQPDWTWRA